MNKISNEGFTKNQYQWGSTENTLTIWTNMLKDENKIEEYFLERGFTYCEKFDGTNIGKDIKGVIYSWCLVLGMYEDFDHDMKFINTSLENVHETDIKSF